VTPIELNTVENLQEKREKLFQEGLESINNAKNTPFTLGSPINSSKATEILEKLLNR